MRVWIKPTLSCLACFAAACSAPQVPPPPTLVDIDSEEFQKEMAVERRAALENTSKSSTNVTRKFYVGWEMHHGYHLIPADAPNGLVSVDFIDDRVVRQFDDANGPRGYPAGAEIPHLGRRLVCECTGVEWTFYGQQRFLVRAAKLAWQ